VFILSSSALLTVAAKKSSSLKAQKLNADSERYYSGMREYAEGRSHQIADIVESILSIIVCCWERVRLLPSGLGDVVESECTLLNAHRLRQIWLSNPSEEVALTKEVE
jgi:hypothetical protein